MRYATTEAVMRANALKMGVPFEEYRDNRAKGKTRCFRCKKWFEGSSNKACKPCYQQYVREQYARKKHRAQNPPATYEPEERHEPQPPTEDAWKRPDFLPCKGSPGSEDKILALIHRYEHGLPLWHDDDAVYGKTEQELAGCSAPPGGNAFVYALFDDNNKRVRHAEGTEEDPGRDDADEDL